SLHDTSAAPVACRSRSRALARRPPQFPRRIAAGMQIFKDLTVLERVHAHPEPRVLPGHQSLSSDQPLERLNYQFLAFTDVIEDVRPKSKIAAVDPDVRRLHRLNRGDPVFVL